VNLTTTGVLMNRTYIDIQLWWPKDDEGKPLSVYAVYKTIEGTRNEVTRHTLTRAKDGLLEKADISNLKALARLCSIWSGENLSVDDLIVEESDN
jgi:hypothetical protein